MAKRKNSINVSPLISLFVILVFVGIMIYAIKSIDLTKVTGDLYDDYAVVIKDKLNDILENQEVVDKKLLTASSDKQYTLNNPYVELNPYGISKLSAIIIFNTDKAVSVDVYLNDEYIFKMSNNSRFVIPIYGLIADYDNKVKLVSLDEENNQDTKEITISTNVVKNTKLDRNVDLEDSKYYFEIGTLNRGGSDFRGYDKDNNLVFNINLNYIYGYKLRSNRISLAYNQSNEDKNSSLKLEMDYLGRIYNVSEDISELDMSANTFSNDLEYISYTGNLYYKDVIDNYSFDEVIIENNNYYNSNVTKISLLAYDLSSVEKLNGELSVIPNGNTIKINTNNKSVQAMLVSVDEDLVYIYDIKDNKIVTNIKGKYLVYLKVGTTVYRTDKVVDL